MSNCRNDGMKKEGCIPMSTQELPPPSALYRMITGFYVSQAIYVMARLGIADFLSDGPLDTEELAQRSTTHVQSLKRVLRLLVTAGLFTEDNRGRFALTPIGDQLSAGAPGSMRATALLFGGITQRAWGDLLYSVETGEPAFRQVFGQDSFAYMAKHPEEAANFDAAMGAFTAQIATAVAAAYDFSGFRRIVDVGGGNGALLAGILRESSNPPSLKGTLFDLPQIVERARPRLGEIGLADRCEAVGGDVFVEVPGGADAYLLKHVIHDWDDDRAVAILRNCRKAMSASAKLLIIEGVYPPQVDQSEASRRAAANDVNMLVCTGGRQRSEAEFRKLYTAAGFVLSRIITTDVPFASIIEGVRK
jgi:O-methyltransferase domain/Dimerisation domain